MGQHEHVVLSMKPTLATFIALFIMAPAAALATGPSSCPAGQTALAQEYGTSKYCALTICVPEYRHADAQRCVLNQTVPPTTSCWSVHYEARPRFPQPPSPAGSWGNQPTCPMYLNSAGHWY